MFFSHYFDLESIYNKNINDQIQHNKYSISRAKCYNAFVIGMNVDTAKFRRFGRTFSIITGSLVGLLIIALFNLIGENTNLFITSVHNINFFNEMFTVERVTALFISILAIFLSGMLTTYLLTRKKRSCIFGGITGIVVMLMTMIYCYLSGTVFPTSSIASLFGQAGILLDFIIHAVPISMIGFIFGYMGGCLAKLF